jgi:hypothetical protein
LPEEDRVNSSGKCMLIFRIGEYIYREKDNGKLKFPFDDDILPWANVNYPRKSFLN